MKMEVKSYKLFISSTQACSSAQNASLTSIEAAGKFANAVKQKLKNINEITRAHMAVLSFLQKLSCYVTS